jgi:Secretion system C-terminal sorting domain
MPRLPFFTAYLFLLSAGSGPIRAQDIVATAGNGFSNATLRITFTIGEVVIATHASVGTIITQGFNQPEDDFTTSVIDRKPSAGIAVFPNPARDEVQLVIDAAGAAWACTLIDASGRTVTTWPITAPRTSLDLSSFANGPYTLRVADEQGRDAHLVQLLISR